MRRVAFDVETHWIKPGMLAPGLVCLAWCDGKEGALLGKIDGLAWLRKALRDPEVFLGGHNVPFDLGVACAEDPTLVPLVFKAMDEGRLWCTQVRQQLIDIARGELMTNEDGVKNYRRRPDGSAEMAALNLAALVSWWFQEYLEKQDTWRLHYNELDGIPIEEWPEEAKTYVLADVSTCHRVYDAQDAYVAQRDEFFPEGRLYNQIEQLRAAWALHLMAMWGIRTDPAATQHLREVLEAEQAEAVPHLVKAGIYVPKKKSEPHGEMKKSMAVIYQKMLDAYAAKGQPCPMTKGGTDKPQPDGTIKKGKPPVPETSKEAYLASGDEDLKILGLSMAGAKLLNTYVPVLERGIRWPICAHYNVLVETGRTSCSNPNMQNPPRKGGIRECFIPRLGTVLCSIDFDTAELRSLAQICLQLVGFSKLGEALKAGKDPHLMLAAEMLKISEEECERRFKAGDKAVDEMRQFCKVGNFGFPGGLGEATFIGYAAGYGIEVSLEQATKLRAAWFNKWTEMRKYFAKINGITGSIGGNIMQIRVSLEKDAEGKRKLIGHRRRGLVFFTEAANGMFQGLTADGVKEALYNVAKACYLAQPGDVLYGVRPVAFLHDEIISEIPWDAEHPERASAAAYELARIMRESMELWVPDIPIKCGPAMFRRWLKGAKPAFVGDVLVPSKPETIYNDAGEKTGTRWIPDV